jgi:hypothetical protein
VKNFPDPVDVVRWQRQRDPNGDQQDWWEGQLCTPEAVCTTEHLAAQQKKSVLVAFQKSSR